MKIYLAGNTPGREKEEKAFKEKGLANKRLFAYHFLIAEKAMLACFKIRVEK